MSNGAAFTLLKTRPYPPPLLIRSFRTSNQNHSSGTTTCLTKPRTAKYNGRSTTTTTTKPTSAKETLSCSVQLQRSARHYGTVQRPCLPSQRQCSDHRPNAAVTTSTAAFCGTDQRVEPRRQYELALRRAGHEPTDQQHVPIPPLRTRIRQHEPCVASANHHQPKHFGVPLDDTKSKLQ